MSPLPIDLQPSAWLNGCGNNAHFPTVIPSMPHNYCCYHRKRVLILDWVPSLQKCAGYPGSLCGEDQTKVLDSTQLPPWKVDPIGPFGLECRQAFSFVPLAALHNNMHQPDGRNTVVGRVQVFCRDGTDDKDVSLQSCSRTLWRWDVMSVLSVSTCIQTYRCVGCRVGDEERRLVNER